MKIAIIGAGGAGLCAGRQCLEENHSIDIFEQTGNVGGTWNYTDSVGSDENGVPIHSSMYRNLMTNLPKELMAYEDFPYPKQELSYLPQQQVLNYINSYSEKFQLEPHIKFYKRVTWIEPENNLWSVEFEDVRSKETLKGFYDAVIVCNGHYKDPFRPDISGIENFSGGVKHSHEYRSPEGYKNRRVLVVGAGPSGTDISQQILKVADKVYLSHKSETPLKLSENLNQKPQLIELIGQKAFFEDGTSEEIDDILLCTGYIFTFPFLSEICGIKVVDNYVHPLYKHIISIENPTLAFIGLPFKVCPFPMFDIQVRFFLSTLNGHFMLPSKEVMLKNLEEEVAKKVDRPMRLYHLVGEDQGIYFDELANTAKIKRAPPVISNLYLRVRQCRNLYDCFRIIDDEQWEQIK